MYYILVEQSTKTGYRIKIQKFISFRASQFLNLLQRNL